MPRHPLNFFSYFICSAVLVLSACADGEVRVPVPASDPSKEVPLTIVPISLDNIGQFVSRSDAARPTNLPQARPSEYRIGVGDVISVNVLDQVELTMPTEDPTRTMGYLVQGDGTFSFPFLDSVEAKGKTVRELQRDVTARLRTFIPDPQIDIRVVAYNSQRVVVGGEVRSPSTQSITASSLTLLEAVNAAGGMTDTADARRIIVRRSGRNYEVDLQGFLEAGMDQNNPVLLGGDIVSVPKRKRREAYILGEVSEPATLDLSEEAVSLTQAIARQGGINGARADARGVFVFRGVGLGLTVYQLDLSSPVGLLLGARFFLDPDDVVYVTRSSLQRWNDTISRLLPTVSAVRSVEAH